MFILNNFLLNLPLNTNRIEHCIMVLQRVVAESGYHAEVTKEWCENDIGSLRRVAQDRNKWKEMVKCALDTYRISAHGK